MVSRRRCTRTALVLELKRLGLSVESPKEIDVYYQGQQVGEYWADIVVNGLVMIELKAVRQLLEEHEAQLLNYLKATSIEVGLLLNFGPRSEVKRKVYDNERKGSLGWTQPGSLDTGKHGTLEHTE